MGRLRWRTWLQALLLTIPLVILVFWVARGAARASHGPEVPAAAPAAASAEAAGTEEGAGSRPLVAGLPRPEADVPADRLEEIVDGAADYLRRQGCRRLIAWKLTDPPADIELLVFEGDEGAKAVLQRDAGPGRQPGPGDESSLAEESIRFRRGPYYARLFAYPGSDTAASSGLLEIAWKIDAALEDPAGANP